MINSIDDNIGYYNSQVSSTSPVSSSGKATNKKAVEPVKKVTTTVAKQDTLELSANYKAAKANAAAKPAEAAPSVKHAQVSSDTKTEKTASTDILSSFVASVKSDKSDSYSDLTSTASAATSSPVLTTLSETKLRSLVSDGTITQKEMDAELARRTEKTSDEVEIKSQRKAQDLTSYQKQGIQTYIQQINYANPAIENGSIISIA